MALRFFSGSGGLLWSAVRRVCAIVFLEESRGEGGEWGQVVGQRFFQLAQGLLLSPMRPSSPTWSADVKEKDRP
jgi:hypothetical protein